MLTSADALAKLARWWLGLLELDFEVMHLAAIKRPAPDSLSMLKTEGSDETSLYEQLPVLMIGETK